MKSEEVGYSSFVQTEKGSEFYIYRNVGRGANSNVYHALDKQSNKSVALKVINNNSVETPLLMQRFNREADIMYDLEGANSVDLYEHGLLSNGDLYLSMEFVPGTTLEKELNNSGNMDIDSGIKIVWQMLIFLAHSHKFGVVHRDIKPDNIFLDSLKRVRVGDFGLAVYENDQPFVLTAPDPDLDIQSVETATGTRVGTYVGTPNYSSPEQGNGLKVDIRSDIYSLGCVWYKMLTGRVPFQRESGIATLKAHTDPEILPQMLGQENGRPEFTINLITMLFHMIRKNPKDRYQTPLEVLRDLDQLQARKGFYHAESLSDLLIKSNFDDPTALIPVPSTERSVEETVVNGRKVDQDFENSVVEIRSDETHTII
tara:strand:+ start:2427 stop:3539 length:1113 start_codon:yes stop_codon:yes gene_type:complete